jgi:perosamine synthetase
MESGINRRRFLDLAAAGSVLASITRRAASPTVLASDSAPALLGGRPVRSKPWPAWPVFDSTEKQRLHDVLTGGKWFRNDGDKVARFEEAYALLTGARHCLATANGTSALITSLAVLDAGPGDEVIVPPYTFVATVNAVLLLHALPVFVDTDPETFQIDPAKIEGAITERTTVLLPVHIGGLPADLDSITQIAQRHRLPVLEDACQAHLAEWRGRKVGTCGKAGCFSFQASKHLNSGEGGAIISDDPEFIENCYIFHNNSYGRRPAGGSSFSYSPRNGANLRLTEFQGTLLLAQMNRLEEQSRTREENAKYLTGVLSQIPGISPARVYEGTTRAAYHLFMFRYSQDAFQGLPRDLFLKALSAEGVPCSPGYRPLNSQPSVRAALQSRGYRRIYPAKLLEEWNERNACPRNDALCEEAVWFLQNLLLASKSDMDQVADAIRKIQKNAGRLKQHRS